MLLACGGTVSKQDADAGRAQTRTIPLCVGSPPESHSLCQSLRYGDKGYCNAWVACH